MPDGGGESVQEFVSNNLNEVSIDSVSRIVAREHDESTPPRVELMNLV